MPLAPLRPCPTPRCSTLTRGGKCEAHRTQVRQESDQRRGSAAERGYNWTWHKARTAYLLQHPLCTDCTKDGRTVSATVVDHIIPHQGQADPLFWDVTNWSAKCKRHHDEKTARQDGGFGHARRYA